VTQLVRRRLGAILLTVLAVVAIRAPASAQLGPWTVSVALGWGAGESLWSVDRQPVVSSFTLLPTDTVVLGRAIGAGVHVGAGLAYRPTSHLGLTAEFFYLDTPVRSTCRPINVGTPLNATWCAATDGEKQTNPSYGLMGGLRLELVPSAWLRPYVRASLGAVVYSVSTVAVEGLPPGFHATVIADSSPHKSATTALLAVGVARALGSKRELQLEIRDVMIDFERVTAPANAAGMAPTRRQMAHEAVLALGIRMDLHAITH
jgi:outer membrane protein with beta-barrel domain